MVTTLSRITRDRNALAQDDRLDSMQMACAYMVEYLNKDQDKAVDERKKDLLQKDLDNFMQSAVGRKPKEKSWINLI